MVVIPAEAGIQGGRLVVGRRESGGVGRHSCGSRNPGPRSDLTVTLARHVIPAEAGNQVCGMACLAPWSGTSFLRKPETRPAEWPACHPGLARHSCGS
ncbi:MAG: hypothetical protein OXR07_07145, partial [Nitrospira sp.]|nr:hypothetical protein [Nitrospira sp.]